VLITVGSLFLLDALGVVRVRFWELFWPAIIILVGARMIMQTPSYRRRRHGMTATVTVTAGTTSASATGPGTVSMFSVLGSDSRAVNDKPFRGGDVTTIIGGTQLDLRQAVIEPGEQAMINIFVLMGGHELWVPPGWTVIVEVSPVLGGVEDKRLPQVLDNAPRAAGAPHRLVLRGVVMLGGLTIKN
jgi:predicted membrane protein